MKKELVVSHLNNYFVDATSSMYSHVVSPASDCSAYHDHDFYEICLILQGTVTHIINGQTQTLSAKDVVFLRPKDQHCLLSTKDDALYRDILFEKTFFEHTCSFLSEDLIKYYNQTTLPLKLSLSTDKLLYLDEKANDFLKIPIYNTKEKDLIAKFILSELLSIYYSLSQKVQTQNFAYPPIINEIISMMHMPQLFKEGLGEILRRTNYNKSYLCRLFKQHVGITMTDYINEVKLNHFASQLKLTNKTILQLSCDLGFSCVAHLNKLFIKNLAQPHTNTEKALTPPPKKNS